MNDVVDQFEKLIAKFYGAPYAVATDCCTHAIELCLRIEDIQYTINCPTRTYVSVPMTFMKLGLDWKFDEYDWQDYYFIGCTNIIDAAVYWKQNGYIAGTKMCLSFQHKKHLSLGRGGMILLDDYDEYIKLKKMSYDGRLPNIPWGEQDIDILGYHYYMTPETAQRGIYRYCTAEVAKPKIWTSQDYPNLSKMKVFNAQ